MQDQIPFRKEHTEMKTLFNAQKAEESAKNPKAKAHYRKVINFINAYPARPNKKGKMGKWGVDAAVRGKFGKRRTR